MSILESIWFACAVIAVFFLLYVAIGALANIYKYLRVRNAEASEIEARAQLAWLAVQEKTAQIQRYVADIELVESPGHLPVSRRLLVDGSLANAQLQLISEEIATRRPVQPVPQTVHYAPHYARVDAPTRVDLDDDRPAIIQKPSQNFWELWTAGSLPDKGFLMGHNLDTGEPVHTDWKQLYSALIGGQSGSGKSTLIRSLLTQSAVQGGRFVVLDKHYQAGEESLGASIQPLRSRLMCDIAATEKQMTESIKFMRHIGGQRLAGVDKDKTPVILVVDETTALLSRSDIADELKYLLGEISQETRKVGVYALCIGQNFHSQIMDTTVRNSFVSMISCRTRPDVARTMTGSGEFGKLVGTISTGQAVWMNTNGEMIRLSVPNTTQKHVEMIAGELEAYSQVVQPTSNPLPTHFQPTSNPLPQLMAEAAGKRLGSDSEVLMELDQNIISDAVKTRLVRDMMANGATQTDMIKKIWSVSGGRAYKNAVEELKQIMAYIARGVNV